MNWFKYKYRLFLKINFIIILAITFSLISCEEDTIKTSIQTIDTIHPVINLIGNKIDTTYLQISSTTLIANGSPSFTWLPGNSTENYFDRGASVFEAVNGVLRCSDIPLEITGSVNNKFPGTYILYYNAMNATGNKAATVTRTVHVVQNDAAIFNGDYQVACTCSAFGTSSPNPIVTTNNYIANATTSSNVNNSFSLSELRIGAESVTASVSINGNFIDIGFFSADNANSSLSGTVSAAKNTFTIESKVLTWSTAITYFCKNVYTKSNIEKNFVK